MKQYLLILSSFFALLYPFASFAQDIPPDWEPNIVNQTVRSVNVSPKDIVGQPNWCSYAIDRRIAQFMDPKKLKDYQSSPFWNLGDKFKSCMWISACGRSWDFAYPFISTAMSSAEGIQIRKLQEKREKVPERNEQAKKENKPLQDTPVGLSPLKGDKDSVDYFYIPLEGFVSLMKYDCNKMFDEKNLVKKIDPNLSDESDEQDEAYVDSYQYAFGMFQEMHYRYLQMNQLHILFLSKNKISLTSYIYKFQEMKFIKKDEK